MSWILRLLSLSGILLLSACSNTPQQPVLPSQLTWSDHEELVTQQEHFQANGKIAIRQKDQRTSASLNWTQDKQHYAIFMAGPLGSGAVGIAGSPQGVTMDISGEGRFYAQSPEALMNERLGWSLPLSNLGYWVKGIPAPGSSYQKSLDDQQRLALLKQNNWLIEYKSYYQLADTAWPRKIQLHYGQNLQVTVLIKEWLFNSPAP